MPEKFDVRSVDLAKLNSITKYPSISTYHELDPSNGNLTGNATPFTGRVIGTEKIDGSNARIIALPDGTYLLGSREELLYAKGDLIGNPSQGIVTALKEFADHLSPMVTDAIQVFFVEVYGGKVGKAAKQYSGTRTVGFRLFDFMFMTDYRYMLGRSAEQISSWRENGGQWFAPEENIRTEADTRGFTVAPRLFTVDAVDLPQDIDGMRQFLADHLPSTLSALDDGAGGQPEGIVLRSEDRQVIAKARFEDYDRTIRRRNGKGRK